MLSPRRSTSHSSVQDLRTGSLAGVGTDYSLVVGVRVTGDIAVPGKTFREM